MGDAFQYRLSEDVFFIPDGDNCILYNPVRARALLVNAGAVQALRQLHHTGRRSGACEGAFWEELISEGMLVPLGTETAAGIQTRREESFCPEGLTLFLTTQCSMRCVYCYSSGGDAPGTMTWQTARAALDWLVDQLAAHGRRDFYLSFHGGGEVVLAMDLLKQCVAHARCKADALGLHPRVEVALNGVMRPDEVRWITANVDGATVSLDGVPEIQNRQRPLAGGGDSFAAVRDTLAHMDSCGFRYGLRATVTTESLASLPDSIAFMAENFAADVIQVEPVFLAGRACANGLHPVDPDLFVEKFREASRALRGTGKRLKYSGARLDVMSDCFCKAVTGNAIAVTPDNLVTACYEVSDPRDPRASLFIVGRLDEQTGAIELHQDRIEGLAALRVGNKPHCAKCFCKWHCAGDCPAKLALLGDARDPSKSWRCRINRALTKDQIKEHLLHLEPEYIT